MFPEEREMIMCPQGKEVVDVQNSIKRVYQTLRETKAVKRALSNMTIMTILMITGKVKFMFGRKLWMAL